MKKKQIKRISTARKILVLNGFRLRDNMYDSLSEMGEVLMNEFLTSLAGSRDKYIFRIEPVTYWSPMCGGGGGRYYASIEIELRSLERIRDLIYILTGNEFSESEVVEERNWSKYYRSFSVYKKDKDLYILRADYRS